MKKSMGSLWLKAVFILATAFVQVGVWAGVAWFLGAYDWILIVLFTVMSLVGGVFIIVQDAQAETKLPWIILMLLLPLMGGLIYFTYGAHRMSRGRKELEARIEAELKRCVDGVADLPTQDLHLKRQSTYLRQIAKAPAFANTKVTYFPLGESFHQAMLAELDKAEASIFMEFFIIEPGLMWDSIEAILVEKAHQGVDVRVLFDDLGCMTTLPHGFASRLRKEGVQCYAFNPFCTLFNANFNNRDHRKLCVIDGNVGFTGGVNLADEYINQKVKHGHWKDTAVQLNGQGVYGLSLLFLSMWSTVTGTVEDFSRYQPTLHVESDGVVQPFGDSPLDNEPVGENLYMSMLNRATDYVYITSPYLIISREMMVSLLQAAKSGVDVRVILPGIGDKGFVHFLSRSYYKTLVQGGVKIYEYTPGFVHAKMFLSDDEKAVVGTINLDYRSLALHYECGAFLYQSAVIGTIKEDFLHTQSLCTQITLDNLPLNYRLGSPKFMALGLLRTFAPLM